MWSSAEMTVYRRSARGGSGRKVTFFSPFSPLLAVVHSELARRSSMDSMLRSFEMVGDAHERPACPTIGAGPDRMFTAGRRALRG